MEGPNLNLFLASPSGLEEYRRAARGCAEQVRRGLALPSGIGFELIGWEDVLPGYGRPQGVINPALDECNVLVGILGNRLGSPSGEAESGFVEEFERMAARARAGEEVAILIYTLALGTDELDDPGEKLQAVLAFRERLRREALLRTDLAGPAEFRTALAFDLMRLLGESIARRGSGTAQTAVPAGAEGEADQDRAPMFAGPGEDGAGAQLRDLFAEVAETAPELPGRFREERFPLARIALWLSASEAWLVDNRLFGVHDLNQVYKGRGEAALSALESRQILRAVLAEPEVSPGWALVADDVRALTRRVVALAWEDPEDAVQAGALDALGAAELTGWLSSGEVTLEPEALFARLAGRAAEASWQVRRALIDLALRLGGEQGRALLTALGERHGEAEPLLEARIRLEAPLDPAGALLLGAEAETELGDETLRALEAAMGEADLAEVTPPAAAPTIGVRVLAARALAGKGEGAAPVLLGQLADPEPSVIRAAMEALVDLDPSGVDLEEIGAGVAAREEFRFDGTMRRLLARRRGPEELGAEISWARPETAGSYRALAEDHFAYFAAQLRRDLGDGFAAFKAESRERELSGLAPPLRAALESPPEGIDERTATAVERYHRHLDGGDWNERAFTAAALHGIARNGEDADAELVRPRLGSEDSDVREAAAAALARVGTPEDLPGLLALGRRRRGEPYARAALQISPGPEGVAGELLGQGRSEAALAAARHLHTHAGELSEEAVDRLLAHQQADVRRIGVAIAVGRAGEEEGPLEALLDRVLAGETYFYNVVAVLDRLLHAPPDLRSRTRVELADLATEERPEALRAGPEEPLLMRLIAGRTA